MEEAEKRLKEIFKKNNFTSRNEKIAGALGFLEGTETIHTKDEAVAILSKVFFEEL